MWVSSSKVEKADKRTVSIIVYGGKGLKSENRKHKFAVTCEIGSQKCRTEVVEDFFGNPVFNKEFQIQTDVVSAPLVLLATTKHDKDVLGQVTIPLSELTDERSFTPRRVLLQPGRRTSAVVTGASSGELVYDAWISRVVPKPMPNAAAIRPPSPSTETAPTPTGLARLRRRFNASPIMSKSAEQKATNRRHSTDALIDLKSNFHALSRDDPFGFIPTDNVSLRNAADADQQTGNSPSSTPSTDGYRKRSSLPTVSEQYFPHPLVRKISPKEGPQCGGTVITIDGANMGLSKEDVVGLFVCGVDVLDSLQYVSPVRLKCTTSASKPCVGCVTVETLSGGRASSAVQFTISESTIPESASASQIGERDPVPSPQMRQRSASVGTAIHLLRAVRDDVASTLLLSGGKEAGSNRPKTGSKDRTDAAATSRKLPTPVMEIQPMVNGKPTTGATETATESAAPPKKPPRAMYVCGQPVLPQDQNGRYIIDDMQTTVADYESYRRATLNSDDLECDVKEFSAVTELKAQLTANMDHITELLEENESLKEQYEMLRLYIESLLIRVVDTCPQVLCVDFQ